MDVIARLPMSCELRLADSTITFLFLEKPRAGAVTIRVEIHVSTDSNNSLIMESATHVIRTEYLRMLDNYITRYIKEVYASDPESGPGVDTNNIFVVYGAMFQFLAHGGTVKQGGFYFRVMVRPDREKFVLIGVENSTRFDWCQTFLEQFRHRLNLIEQIDPSPPTSTDLLTNPP